MEHLNILLLTIFLFLIDQAQPATTLSYSFPYNGTSGALQYGTYHPGYYLGTLSLNYSITIKLTVPRIRTSLYFQLFCDYIRTAANNEGLRYWDATKSPPQLVPANGIVYPATKAGMIKYQFTYVISFPSSYKLTSAPFYLLLGYNPFINNLDRWIYYTIQANYFLTKQPIFVGDNSVSLLKAVQMVHLWTMRFFYVSTPQKFNFTLYPGGNGNNDMFIVEIDSLNVPNYSTQGLFGNQWIAGFDIQITSIEKIKSPASPVYVNNIAHYEFNFTRPGFYNVQIWTQIPKAFTTKITFQTDPYACPFPEQFPDISQNFQGCTLPITTKGAPCAIFNAITQSCTQCTIGYFLQNGSCFANTTCQARQYFHFGDCIPVDPNCGDFDPFTGLCLNCNDSISYNFNNGTCVRKNITCAPNQWQANYTCFNASNSCATFDRINGKCLSCKSATDQLNLDGNCTPIIVSCPQGQYSVNLTCLDIPNECLNFDKTLGKCLICIKGYYTKDGVCQRIICPAGQVPSNYGIQCVNVSPLCKDYDRITGDCLSCKNERQTVRNRTCLDFYSPLAGCTQRQILGFGECFGAELFCRIFDLITGNCKECNQGYYLDYKDKCVQEVKCQNGEWSVNGECLQLPENCIKMDQLGLCTACATSDFRLQQGQCVFFKKCRSREYLNSGGQCVDVSEDCGSFNPSNGQCITCKTVNIRPVQGVCCPAGRTYSSGNGCIPINQFDGKDSCMIRHHSISVCLKCEQGYQADYSIPFGCKQTST